MNLIPTVLKFPWPKKYKLPCLVILWITPVTKMASTKNNFSSFILLVILLMAYDGYMIVFYCAVALNYSNEAVAYRHTNQ